MTALKNGNYNFTVLFSYLEDFPTFKTVLLIILALYDYMTLKPLYWFAPGLFIIINY
jgi:hypothetical protein